MTAGASETANASARRSSPSAISLGPVRGERQAQRGHVGRAGEERRAGHVGDVAIQRPRQQRAGVPAVGQPRPHEHAAVGAVVGGAGRERGAEARRAARRGARRSSARSRSMWPARSVRASHRAAAAWSTVEECRSAACLAIVSDRSSIRGARTQPIRRPGAAILDSVEIGERPPRAPAAATPPRGAPRRCSAARRRDRPRRSTARSARPPRPARRRRAAQRAAGRVVERRHRVEQLGPVLGRSAPRAPPGPGRRRRRGPGSPRPPASAKHWSAAR